MNVGITVLAGAMALCTVACTQKVDVGSCKPSSDLLTMQAMKLEAAENDAIRDSGKGDHKLLGIHTGTGLMVPGLATNPATSGYGLRVIEGTDTPCSPEERESNIRAVQYAKKYNQEKLRLWQP